MNLERCTDYLWKIPKEGSMRVDCYLYSSESLMKSEDLMDAVGQLKNVAHLPGIVKAAYGMPDLHWGYGFPIGGVAAFDVNDGIISPGGVGFDINCGVRLLNTQLKYDEMKKDMDRLAQRIFDEVPTGIGKDGVVTLGMKGIKHVVRKGAFWAIESGYGTEEDLKHTEENGLMQGADVSSISVQSVKRGGVEMGSLGSGNHFIEIQRVTEIYDEKVATALGLEKGVVTIMFHTGSRGFGHQICTDYIKRFRDEMKEFNISIPDKQLICAPFKSQLGQDYFSAMAAAANYAWANRQVLTGVIRKVIKNTISSALTVPVIYDVSHNIAKVETHIVDGVKRKLVVHRKGATRSLGKGNPLLPEDYVNVGQPVIVPGDMGTASYLLVGTKEAEEQSFASAAHGAGRQMSRRRAKEYARTHDEVKALKGGEIPIYAKSNATIAEEIPEAYKDIDEVVHVMENASLAKRVAKMVPVGVIKG